jgi:hypothetical protein
MAIGYDRGLKELHIQFHGGRTFIYADVPEDAHVALMSAESVGKHYHAHIKGKYQDRKHEDKKESE